MSDYRDGMEVGDDEEMSEVGSPPDDYDVRQEALAQNEMHLEEYDQRLEAELENTRKEVAWMGQFGFEEENYAEPEWRETAAIKRYCKQYEAAGQYLDALAQVVAVVVPRVVSASTQVYVRELERMLPHLMSRYQTLVHPPAKFGMHVGVDVFNVKEWRASNASARMGSLMWYQECGHCIVQDIMQRAQQEMWWMKHAFDRLQRTERELKQVMTAYDESVRVMRKSREHERGVATLSMYRRTRTLMKETVQAVEDVQREVLRGHADSEALSLERDITPYAFEMENLMTQLPEPSSFYRETHSVCVLNLEAFRASDVQRSKVMEKIFVDTKPMDDRLEWWHAGHSHEMGVVETQVWQAYKDKVTALHDVYRVGVGENWSWSFADHRGDPNWKKQFLRKIRPS